MNEIEINKIAGSIEALLFIYGEPLSVEKLSTILNVDIEQIKAALDNLKDLLNNEKRGLALIFDGSKAQLVTRPEFSQFVENLVKDEYEQNLTPASLETLSLVGYLGPISRSQIDYYRGVNSSYTLRNLMMMGLVEKTVDEKNKHNSLYQVSFNLLKHLGISKVEDLPDYQKFQTILSNKGSDILSGGSGEMEVLA